MLRFFPVLWFALAGATAIHGETPPDLSATATVEFGVDRGQNLGTLFEVLDAQGRVIAGAGFLAAYNTQPRSDRELVQVFVRPPGVARSWDVARLPGIDSPATGFYPFCVRGELYLHNRSEKGRKPTDPRVYRWDSHGQRWIGEADVVPYSERVAGRILEVTSEGVRYDGRWLLQPESGASFAEHYYGAGNLFLKEANRDTKPPLNRVIVCPWRPEVDDSIALKPEWTLELPIPFEFIYAFGQWRDEVIVVSNNGRVLRFNGQGWATLREPIPKVSFQVYSALTYYDRLLLGHYPTGEIYEYAGEGLKLLNGWPPILPGVSSSAREAQTLAIYGGDLYAGVWPWGEIWRFDREQKQWAWADRMFKHPLPTAAVVHPYETETKRVDAVLNLWGQRITGLQPHGPGLVITTSSKGSSPWEPKFDFLSAQQRSDYGATYVATVPGNLAAPIEWKTGSTQLEVKLIGNSLVVSQENQSLGSVTIPAHLLVEFHPAKVVWGEGVFGPFTGKLLETADNFHAGPP